MTTSEFDSLRPPEPAAQASLGQARGRARRRTDGTARC